MTDKKKKLTPKEQAFVDEYPLDKNATKAAIRAGYSEKTAYSIGQRLLKKVEIKKAIAFKLEKAAKRNEITLDRVLQEYARIAFADVRTMYCEDTGRLLDITELGDDTAATVASFEVTKAASEEGVDERIHKLKTYDKTKALSDLMRHLGGFANDSVTVKPGEGLAELLQAATNRGHKLPGKR